MDNKYLDIIGLGIFKALNDKRYPILVNGKISESAIPTSITNSITSILSLIPDAASSENKLADKNFVNSSIATNTATFRGTFDDLATLQATSADINDYAFYVHTDEIGNTAYDRYKHNGSAWVFEYTLNNSSFTAEQWSAINSGITTTKVGNYDAHLINYSNPHKVTKSQVGLGNVENVALSSWAGSNKITTLGTITTGVWNGSKIGNDYLANSSITIGTTAISLGSTAKSLAGIEKLQLNDANSNLVYDSTTGSWKLTGNLLVTGFISAGAKGNSSSGGGSTYTQREWAEIKIMSASEIGLLASAYSVKEAYDELNAAIETLAGKATNVTFTQALTSGKQIGSISIDGKSTSLFAPANYAWSEITGKPTFATVATSGSYSDLTNKPTIASLMGSTAIGGTSSYLYWTGSAWATKALGSNAFTSISKVSQLTNDSGYISGITKAMVEGVLTGNITSHTHSYLPLEGGTVTGQLRIKTVLDRSFVLDESEGEKYHIISFRASGEEYAYLLADNKGSENKLVFNGFTILHSSNVGSYALKLDGSNAMTGGINWNNASVGANVDTFGEGLIVGKTTDSGTTLDGLGYKYASVLNVSNGVYRFQIASAAANANKLLYRGYDANAKTYFDWKTIAFTDSNVASSSKWSTPRTITLTGSVTGSVSIDGSQNVSLATTTNHTHNYLPLSGGTLTGSITMQGMNTNLIRNITYTSTSSWARGLINLQVDGISKFSISALGDYTLGASDNGINYAYIGCNSYDGLNLRISATSLSWGDNSILHSGNYNSYALPLSGGTVTGALTINTYIDSSFILDEPTGEKYHIISFRASGEEYAYLLSDNHGSENKLVFNGSTILHSGNYNTYSPKLDGTGASGTWGISISKNAATATNADKLDGVHYQNILERQYSGSGSSGTATGWFRIAETLNSDAGGTTFLLAIQRSYRYINNESYLFSISISYGGGISITQLSGYANSRLITKIRVDWTPSQIAYVDLYINTSSKNNNYYWYTVGDAKSYTAWTANPTLNGTAYEFTTVNGCKSDKGFTGDLSGNATTVGGITGALIPASNVSTGYWGELGYGSTKKLSIGTNYGDVAWNAQNYCAGLMFGCNLDTHGFISIGYNSPIVSFAGSNNSNASNDNPNWYFKLKGTTGTTYDLNCAPTATKLATSRTIWGQSFDGTGNVSGALTGVTTITTSGQICINTSSSQANNYNEGIRCNLGGSSNWASVVLGGASGSTNGTGSGVYSLLVNSSLFRIRQNSTEVLCINTSNNVGIGTTSPSYKLHIAGVAYASEGLVSDGYISAAATSTSSDIRLKDDISEISSEMALKWLSMLKPKSWTWNSLAGVEGRSMGFVAQDVEGILPQMIRKRRDNGYLSLDYTQLHALEVSALQSHEKRIEELERENKILKAEINKLKQYAN